MAIAVRVIDVPGGKKQGEDKHHIGRKAEPGQAPGARITRIAQAAHIRRQQGQQKRRQREEGDFINPAGDNGQIKQKPGMLTQEQR
nr:hypothetical protein [Serratia ficaria]